MPATYAAPTATARLRTSSAAPTHMDTIGFERELDMIYYMQHGLYDLLKPFFTCVLHNIE